MSTVNTSLNFSLKTQTPLVQKAIGTVLSFFISLAIFIMIRVIGVIYFKDTFVEIVKFSPIAALNFMVWLGVIAMLLIGFVTVNFTIATDKFKLNMDVISAAVISIGFYWLIAYNYIGFNYPYLLNSADIASRLLYWNYWISILAIYGSIDLFLFWLGVSVVFHVVFFFFSAVDLEDKMFSAFERNKVKQKELKSRKKRSPTIDDIGQSIYDAKDFFIINLITTLMTFIVLYIPTAYIMPELSSALFSPGGIILLIGTSMVNTLFYILSKRIVKKSNEILFFLGVSLIFTVVNIFFIVIQNWIVAIILIVAAIIIIEVLSNTVVKH